MFHFSLLAAVSEKTTDIVTWVSIGCLAALAIALTLLCIFGKKYSTREIAYAGICLALSFALSFIKVSPVHLGGSITLASFVPLLIYAYKFGPVKGTLAGIMLGLFNFISGPYILTPLTFILDYVLAFASIGLMGFAPKFGKLSITAKVTIGTVLVYVARFIFHLLSGFIYFAENAIWVDLPTPNMFVYSFIYQCVYLPADCVICIIVLFATAKTKALDKLLAMMDVKHAKAKQAVTDEEFIKQINESEFVKKMEEDIAIAESEEQNATENKTKE
ncbi:MAG: energy-coupled thiamine transporter ThiT [Clostridia bacterium]|nr:energy-coupled thiamine transporter ThiT [Clostridia bacterium]